MLSLTNLPKKIMGLSIHYSGSIIHEGMINPLVEEVTDICITLQWKFHLFDDEHFKGISFSPLNSEPVFLTFIPDGRLCSYVTKLNLASYEAKGLDLQFWYTERTKTHYGGIDAHIAIIKLLKYVSKKYLKDFVLDDEGKYWETGDEQILKAQFDNYNRIMGVVADLMSNMKNIPFESSLSLAERIEKVLKDKLKGLDEKKDD